METRDGPIARIVYASESNLQGPVFAALEAIRATALAHNVPLCVHTALLHQSGFFVQWSEGPVRVMPALMERIEADPRHRNLRIVHSSRGPRMLSGPWSMAMVDARESHAAMAGRVAWAHECAMHGRQYGLPAIWRHLATPHHAGGQPGEPDRFQRVMVCGSETSDAFELVQWLASAHARPVVHRRFAGEAGLDVGTDYVDFDEDGQPFRVIAMARNGLQLPLTRAFVADYSQIVLLLGGDPARDLGLVHRVGEACAQLAAPPPVAGVAEDPAVHARVMPLAAQCRLQYAPVLANPEFPPGVWQSLAAQWGFPDTLRDGGAPP